MPKKEMYTKTGTISPALPKPSLNLFLRSGPGPLFFFYIFLTFLPILFLKKSSNLPENWSFFKASSSLCPESSSGHLGRGHGARK